MRVEGAGFDLALDSGTLLRLEEPRGIEVICKSGRVWITEERSLEDIWLKPGQRARLGGNGLAVLEASGNAHIRLQ